MSILHIAITDADEDAQRRAVEALQAAGIEVYRAWIERTPFDDAQEDAACDHVRERWDGPYRMRHRCTAAAGHRGEHGPWQMIR